MTASKPVCSGAAPLRQHRPTPEAMTPLSVIIRLAKRDVRAELRVSADGHRSIEIVSVNGGRSNCLARVAYGVFAVARDNGWLCDPDGAGLVWTLSQEGRLVIRRAKSSGEGAIPSTSSPVTPGESLPTLSQPSVDAAESPLAWLRSRRDKAGRPMISAVQFDAGERLRSDVWFAQMSPRVTANWSATGGSSGGGSGLGVDIRDNVAAAQQRVRRAMSAVGPISAGLLIDVCGHLIGLEQIERARGWPPRSGKIALQMALCELARHYGLSGAVTPVQSPTPKVNHWGTDDFRPKNDHDSIET